MLRCAIHFSSFLYDISRSSHIFWFPGRAYLKQWIDLIVKWIQRRSNIFMIIFNPWLFGNSSITVCRLLFQTSVRSLENTCLSHTILPELRKSLFEQNVPKYDLQESLIQAGLSHFFSVVSMVHNEKVVIFRWFDNFPNPNLFGIFQIPNFNRISRYLNG